MDSVYRGVQIYCKVWYTPNREKIYVKMRKRTRGNAKEKKGRGKMKGKFGSKGPSKCKRGKKCR
jgi:hypothetical protein